MSFGPASVAARDAMRHCLMPTLHSSQTIRSRCSDLSKPDCLPQFETAARTLELMTLASISNMTRKVVSQYSAGTHYYLSLSYLYYLIFSSNS
jgi:hypothetical protein